MVWLLVAVRTGNVCEDLGGWGLAIDIPWGPVRNEPPLS